MKKAIIIAFLVITVVASYVFLSKFVGNKYINPVKNGQLYSVNLLSDVAHLQPEQQTTLRYTITDAQGNVLKDFAPDHEKLMHLVIVRQDLQDFQHLHPDFNKVTGEFTVPVTFLSDGTYRLYADFVAKEETSKQTTLATPYYDVHVGDLEKYKQEAKPVLPDSALEKKVGEYSITYSFTNPVTVGKLATITAHVTKNGQPVTNMQQYLGAQAHGIVLKAGSSDFAHIHAMGDEMQNNTMSQQMDMNMTNTGPDITFHYVFPTEGIYKLFTQFQHQGRVITSDITILVIPDPYGKEVSTMNDSVAPVTHTIVFENDQVRVVRYLFQPHAKIPTHQAPNIVAIYLTDSNLQLVFPNGRIQNEVRKPGEAVYLPAGEHSGENLADTPLEFIAVQLKENI